jgi:hypothetical protein
MIYGVVARAQPPHLLTLSSSEIDQERTCPPNGLAAIQSRR